MHPFVLGLAVAVSAFVLDQLSKWWILEVVTLPARPMIEVTGFFNLVMVWNTGVSFGMFAGHGEFMRWVLFGLSGILVAALTVWLMRVHTRYMVVALGLVIGGAIGNMVDRVRYGAVADFLDFHMFGWHWPAFNVADSFIFIGVAMLCLDTLVCGSQQKETNNAD